MKIIMRNLGLLAAVAMLLLTAGCEREINIASNVGEDGSIERTIVLSDVDSSKIGNNMFGANAQSGWKCELTRTKKDGHPDKEINVITFTRKYASVEDANKETNRPVDTLFHLVSKFETHNRWFYTYAEYSDTYLPINRFHALSPEEFFTPEDYSFIGRLPAEGDPISIADSLYLSRLNEKIFDIYAAQAIFDEHFSAVKAILQEEGIKPHWLDTLQHQRRNIYPKLLNENDLGDEFMLPIIDSLQIPISKAGREQYSARAKEIGKRIDFMSDANEGKYMHAITMPWDIVTSNADSVHQRTVFWRPPVTKFLLTEYVMTATARKLNDWALIITALFVLTTAWLFLRKSRTP